MNYTYKLRVQGLCCELNSLLGFYESVSEENCRIYIDASVSSYFKDISIYDVFNFPDVFVDVPHEKSTTVTAQDHRDGALKHYKPSLTTQECTELFSYTTKFQEKLNENISNLSLPRRYKCFHIRRGDKVGEMFHGYTKRTGKTEASRFNFTDYLKISDRSIETVFVMSDDYSSILEAQDHGVDVMTLTAEDETGHSTDLDTRKNRHYCEEELIRFFSEIEIAKQSQQFIGTASSNVYRYIKNLCTGDNEFLSLD